MTSAGWGIYWTAMKILLREWPPLFARGIAGLCAAAILALVGFAMREPTLSATGGAITAYMTIVPMGVCYLTWFAAVRRLAPATASMATLLTPAIGVISAALVLDEPLGLRHALALLLVIGGVALALQRRQ